MTPPDEAGVLRAVTHNVWVGQTPTQLDRHLTALAADTHHPHAIAVQEAKRLRKTIDGYQRVAIDFPNHHDDLGCQLLVREDVEVVRRRLVPVDGPWWTGPKHGIRHPPKIFVGATLEHAGIRWDVLSTHRVWTGPHHRNPDAWQAEHDALAGWMEARSRIHGGTRPVIALGDWNARASDTGPTSIRRLADRLDGSLHMFGIDGVLAINVQHTAAKELPGRYGSDGHQPVATTHHTKGTK